MANPATKGDTKVELLVKKAKRGDAEAFITLIEENKQSMYKVARGFLQNEEDAAATEGMDGTNP